MKDIKDIEEFFKFLTEKAPESHQKTMVFRRYEELSSSSDPIVDGEDPPLEKFDEPIRVSEMDWSQYPEDVYID